jgi:hypothetical protein
MKKIRISPAHKLAEKFRNLLPAKDFVPEWYRTSSPTMEGRTSRLQFELPIATTSTYKKCTPFLEAMIDGYMIKLTSDVEVTRTEEGNPFLLTRSRGQAILAYHPENQWKGLHVPKGYHREVFKFENNFVINTPKTYSILFTHPLNRFDLPFFTISGFVDTDKFELPVNFPFFLQEGFQGIIEEGTPIAQIHLIKREDWGREFLPFNQEDRDYANEKILTKIKRTYKTQFWVKKSYS